jgi:hypothetical protein
MCSMLRVGKCNIPSPNAEIVSLNESVYLRVVECRGKVDLRSYVAGKVSDCRGRISRARVEGCASRLIGLAGGLDAAVRINADFIQLWAIGLPDTRSNHVRKSTTASVVNRWYEIMSDEPKDRLDKGRETGRKGRADEGI